MSSSISKYLQRRDFNNSPEPRGSDARPPSDRVPMFVLHEHETDLPHLDLRLEIDGVLKSWVVPDGLPTDPGQQREALQMEDHPLEYADFEGVIPEGEYGAGTVRIRDKGFFENLTEKDEGLQPPHLALENGYLVFRLQGDQVQAAFVLQRTGTGAEPQWHLVLAWDKESP